LTRKNFINYYGYKNHVGVDNENKLIRRYYVITALGQDPQLPVRCTFPGGGITNSLRNGTGQLGKVGGFSLHGGGLPSGVAVNTRECKKLERICRYISRPALSEARLELTEQGMVSYVGAAFRLKTAYLRGPIGMGLRMWCSSGAAFRHWIGTRSLHGQTGSAGAQTPNELNTISWSTVTGRAGRPRLPSNSRYRENLPPLM